MAAIILSEIQSWRSRYGMRTLAIMISSMLLISVLSLMKPDFCLQAMTIFMIWLGWLSGRQSWSEIKYEEWAAESKITLTGFLAGKLISVLLIDLLHIFLAFPAFVMMMIMWSMPFAAILPVFAVMILSSGIALFFNFIFNMTETTGYEYMGTLLILIWTVITIFFSYLNFLNPIIQVKMIIESGNPAYSLFILGINVIILAVLYFITMFFLYLGRRR